MRTASRSGSMKPALWHRSFRGRPSWPTACLIHADPILIGGLLSIYIAEAANRARRALDCAIRLALETLSDRLVLRRAGFGRRVPTIVLVGSEVVPRLDVEVGSWGRVLKLGRRTELNPWTLAPVSGLR